MSHPALIDALRRKAGEDVEAVWQKARADAEHCRADGARSIEEQRAHDARELAAAASGAAREATAEAERNARRIRGATSIALAERLHQLAVGALPQFRNEKYRELFAALARELPSRQWTRVVVNPTDQSLALEHFPNADVVCDAAIVGGMTVEGGGVRIDNTLETRLGTAWPDLLTGIMTDVLKE